MAMITPPDWVIFHIPHDSACIPNHVRPQFIITDRELEDELLRMTDHHTCELFSRKPQDPQTIYSPVSRLVVDMERFKDDCEEAMAKIGMGAVYTSTSNMTPLRRTITPAERTELIGRYYEPHHSAFEILVSKTIEAFERCLIIDCHSYPRHPLPYEKGAELATGRPEICIGTDSFHTPSRLVDALLNSFRAHRFDAKLNTPFSGAIVPRKYFRADANIEAIMIEVRRDIYMDEKTGSRLANFEEIASRILSSLLLALENYSES